MNFSNVSKNRSFIFENIDSGRMRGVDKMSNQISNSQVETIINLSKEGNHSRPEIAHTVCCSTATVFKHQKLNNLV